MHDRPVVLLHLVWNDIVRALGRQHDSENVPRMFSRKTCDFDDLALRCFFLRPFQAVNPLRGVRTTGIVHLTIVFQWAVVNFPDFLNPEQDFFGCIPGLHQNSPKIERFLIDAVRKHVLHVIRFGGAIAIRVIHTIVDDPKLVSLWIDLHTSHDTETLDHPMCIPTGRSSYQFDGV